ncbi:MAG: HD domain-containing protein [Actinobacteria bacterium]|nr:MAG: HD domain-containing protein [Actinomycetota bacterium]
MRLQSLNKKLSIFRISLLSASLIALALMFLLSPFPANMFGYVLLFTLTIFLTDLIVIDIPREGTVWASVAIILSAVFLGSNRIGALMIMFSILLSTGLTVILPKKNLLYVASEGAKRMLAVGASSLSILFWEMLGGNIKVFWSFLLAAAVASSVYFIVERVIESLAFSIEQGLPFKLSFIRKLRLLTFVYYTFAIVAFLMAMMFKYMGLWSIFIFSLPLVVIGQAFRLYVNIKQTYTSTLKALSATVEAHDKSRIGHAQRVSDCCLDIGRELGFYGDDLEKLNYAAMLHDIGKLGFDQGAKIESDKVSSSKNDDVPFHAKVGAEIISHVEYLKDISSIIKYHHCSYNSKSIIPLESRIIHLADTYDRLINGSKLRQKEALSKLEGDKGFVYDPKVLRALTAIVARQN